MTTTDTLPDLPDAYRDVAGPGQHARAGAGDAEQCARGRAGDARVAGARRARAPRRRPRRHPRRPARRRRERRVDRGPGGTAPRPADRGAARRVGRDQPAGRADDPGLRSGRRADGGRRGRPTSTTSATRSARPVRATATPSTSAATGWRTTWAAFHRDAGHGTLRIETDLWSETFGDDAPATTLRASAFELLRAATGRRSTAQIAAFGWDGPPRRRDRGHADLRPARRGLRRLTTPAMSVPMRRPSGR